MANFIDELKQKKVINKNDVEILKNYINKKYAKNKSIERANILSSTIHHILYTKLKGIPDVHKSSIKINILKNTFVKNKTSINMYDVFSCCLMENDFIVNRTSILTNWINSNISNQINDEDLNTYLKQKKQFKDNLKAKNVSNNKSITNTLNNSDNTNNIKDNKSSNTSFNYSKNFNIGNKKIITFTVIVFIIAFYPVSKIIYDINYNKNFKLYSFKEECNSKNSLKNTNIKFSNTHLPKYMRYQNINEINLKKFLIERKSLLAKEPYFSTIISVAKEFNLNPLVFFAITGQEQNFVPKDTKFAHKIANNPFNVFHSWKEYNTDIEDASKIAARTVINLSKDMPKNSDPFLWIGKSYAEDKNWGKGVKSIFKDLNGKCK